jgi:ubiquitin-like modifier-activating enzyme ATG7
LLRKYHWTRVTVLCYRDALGVTGPTHNMLVDIDLMDTSTETIWPPKCTGWEKNPHGKLAPRLADLGSLMDPKR